MEERVDAAAVFGHGSVARSVSLMGFEVAIDEV